MNKANSTAGQGEGDGTATPSDPVPTAMIVKSEAILAALTLLSRTNGSKRQMYEPESSSMRFSRKKVARRITSK